MCLFLVGARKRQYFTVQEQYNFVVWNIVLIYAALCRFNREFLLRRQKPPACKLIVLQTVDNLCGLKDILEAAHGIVQIWGCTVKSFFFLLSLM